MNEHERELLEGLKALAATEPRQASPRVEQTLRATFRARRERKRRAILGSAAAGVLAVVAAAVVFLVVWVPRHRALQATQITGQHPSAAAEAPEAQSAVVRTDDLAASFYPLPEADELPPLETTLVVRVQLPASSLRLMGFPVGQDPNPEPVQAELLLGQDGLARGVRLVQ